MALYSNSNRGYRLVGNSCPASPRPCSKIENPFVVVSLHILSNQNRELLFWYQHLQWMNKPVSSISVFQSIPDKDLNSLGLWELSSLWNNHRYWWKSILNTFTDFVLHSDFLLEVKATGDLIKGTVNLHKIMDFSGFDPCWRLWDNIRAQLNKMNNKDRVIFRHLKQKCYLLNLQIGFW